MSTNPPQSELGTVELTTHRDNNVGGRQEGHWPGRDELIFGWTLLHRTERSRTTAEIAFRVGETLDRTPVCLKQIHSTNLFLVDQETPLSLENLPRADGIITRRRDLVIGVSVADCIPVFLNFPGGIAVLHAGWRGVVGGILPEALQTLDHLWDISPDSVEALIGPSIGPCCFEVSGVVSALFPPQVRRTNQGRLYIDLPGALIEQWVRHGGRPELFHRADRCTKCGSPRMHSYRRDRSGGRNFAYLYIAD